MDPLERLSSDDVPPVPDAAILRAGARRKLHPRLLAQQLLEFAVWAMLWAAMHLTGALMAAVRYTVTGTWPTPPGDQGSSGGASRASDGGDGSGRVR